MTRWLGLVRVALLTGSLCSAGCFAGYDSRWGQQKQAQQHAAERSTPRQLAIQRSGSTFVSRRALKVRVYATPGYTASIVDWQKQFDALVERVNGVLGPEFGAVLEIAEARNFPTPTSEEGLDTPLQQLTALDPANDVDLVVGLVVATPPSARKPRRSSAPRWRAAFQRKAQCSTLPWRRSSTLCCALPTPDGSPRRATSCCS